MADVLISIGWLAGCLLFGLLLTLIPGELISTAGHRRRCRERHGVDLTWWQAFREGSKGYSAPDLAARKAADRG
jgi:hypothetical protein